MRWDAANHRLPTRVETPPALGAAKRIPVEDRPGHQPVRLQPSPQESATGRRLLMPSTPADLHRNTRERLASTPLDEVAPTPPRPCSMGGHQVAPEVPIQGGRRSERSCDRVVDRGHLDSLKTPRRSLAELVAAAHLVSDPDLKNQTLRGPELSLHGAGSLSHADGRLDPSFAPRVRRVCVQRSSPPSNTCCSRRATSPSSTSSMPSTVVSRSRPAMTERIVR